MPHNRTKAKLMLEDGSLFEGSLIGAPGTAFGELVFNTTSTGYQEVLTDPSYKGQIVLMTYPEIGNYGINREDYESERIHANGFVVRRMSPISSSWRAQLSLQAFLARNGVVGIENVDTRAITRKIREVGAMKSGITSDEIAPEEFLEQIRKQPGLEAQNLVAQVTTKAPYIMDNHTPGDLINCLVVLDFGVKQSILKYLLQFTRRLMVMPAGSTFEEIMQQKPDGILLSNGPGDPSILHAEIATARRLVESGTPIFGICLGHQILALACGAAVTKMRFGHHGGNHPVQDLETGKIAITSQNHGYAVSLDDAFPADKLKITHINLNDRSVEGFRHLHVPVTSVQFHPEASPGPHDAEYLFADFARRIVERSKSPLAV
ncbi:MAG TPA: glutamine-hydrolyzing carbamoyl-phosphate synthase small subunit [Oculatellaceae cyanobacterium]